MIITYGWLDQYKQIGINTYPDWFGEIGFVIPVTPASRVVMVMYEDRVIIIPSEDRATIIPSEDRTVVIAQ